MQDCKSCLTVLLISVKFWSCNHIVTETVSKKMGKVDFLVKRKSCMLYSTQKWVYVTTQTFGVNVWSKHSKQFSWYFNLMASEEESVLGDLSTMIFLQNDVNSSKRLTNYVCPLTRTHPLL